MIGGKVNQKLASPDPTLVADDRGRYVAANDAACRLLGYRREQLLEMSVWQLTPDGHEVEGLIAWKDFIELGFQAGVYWLVRKDRSMVSVEYRAIANLEPGLHVSTLKPLDTIGRPFPRSRLKRAG